MPRPKRAAKLRLTALTMAQRQELSWGKSSDRGPGEFFDDRAKRAAWQGYRAELLVEEGAGSRPAGYWEFDAPLPIQVALQRLTEAIRQAGQAGQPWASLYAERELAMLRHLANSGELGIEEARELVVLGGLHSGGPEHLVQRRAAICREYLDRKGK